MNGFRSYVLSLLGTMLLLGCSDVPDGKRAWQAAPEAAGAAKAHQVTNVSLPMPGADGAPTLPGTKNHGTRPQLPTIPAFPGEADGPPKPVLPQLPPLPEVNVPAPFLPDLPQLPDTLPAHHGSVATP